APTETFNLTVAETIAENGRLRTVWSETFRNLSMDPAAPNNAIAVVNEGSRMIQLDRRKLDDSGDLPSLPGGPPYPRPAATGTLGEPLTGAPGIPADGAAFSVTVHDDVDPPESRP